VVAGLIVYAILGLGVLAALWGVVHWLEARGAEKEAAKWRPQLEAARGEIATLQQEKESWKAASERCAASVKAAQAASQARDKAAGEAIAKARAKAAEQARRLATLAQEAASPHPGATCESAVVAVTEGLS